jgi:hypothetical protein
MHPQALQEQLRLFIPSGAAQILRKIECKNHTQIPSSVLSSVKQAEKPVYENLDHSRCCTEINMSYESERWVISLGV